MQAYASELFVDGDNGGGETKLNDPSTNRVNIFARYPLESPLKRGKLDIDRLLPPPCGEGVCTAPSSPLNSSGEEDCLLTARTATVT